MTLLLLFLSSSELLSSSLFRERLADSITSYTWVRETAPNRSKEIDKFNLDAGVPIGSNWCLSFIYSMAKRVSNALKICNPLPKTAAVWKMLREAKRYGNKLRIIRTRNTADLARGDIGLIKKGNNSEQARWAGHAYVINGIISKNEVESGEGNTNKGGGRNGYMAAIRQRNIVETLAFIRVEL